MSNKRIYELETRNYQQALSENVLMMVDGESLNNAVNLPISSFAENSLVHSGFNTLNGSARYIVSEINDLKSKIPSIKTGFNNNVNVEFNDDTKTYTFYVSSYNLESQSPDVLSINKSVQGSNINFQLSANTYTKPYIDEAIENVKKDYDVVGGNAINVTREGNTNKFNVSFDGITAAKSEEDLGSVSNNSVIINESNIALNHSISQGYSNKSEDYSFAQGVNNIASAFALSQGQDNTGYNISFSQGLGNYSELNSFAQGENNTAIDTSLAQGINNYAYSGSMSLGGYASSYDGSISYGDAEDASNKTIAKTNSISLGHNAYAEDNSYNFFGDSATNHSFCVGHHGLVSNHTTALGTYNEPKYVSGDNPYTFALGDGTQENPHTYFRVDGNGVFYSRAIGHEIDLTKVGEKQTILCENFDEYNRIKDLTENAGKVFIVG